MSRRSRRRSSSVKWVLGLLVVGLFLVIVLCCGVYALVNRLANRIESGTPVAGPSALTVAYS